ncbi:MAG: type II toxin-antitoxin system RelE/ParE family toxin [Dehalococcoidales bacterium]|nr:type II toxin-antitoxin system RelE/ParE family toxin [Dehalococcoidales bacterium]
MIRLVILPPAAKYFKKLKDKKLKALYKSAIDEILSNPNVGEEKTGDLKGIRGFDIRYNRTNYELAYTIEYIPNGTTNDLDAVIIIMAGTRENFYEALKQYWA